MNDFERAAHLPETPPDPESPELIRINPKSLAELGGFAHERLALLFSEPQQEEFQRMLQDRGIGLNSLDKLSEVDVSGLAEIASDLFELEDEGREDRINEIVEFVKERI